MAKLLRRRICAALLIFAPILSGLALAGCDISPEEPVLHGAVETAADEASGTAAE